MIICIHPHHSALQKSLLNAYSSTITVQIIVNHVINNNYLCKPLKVPNSKFADEDLETKIYSKIWKRSLFGHNFTTGIDKIPCHGTTRFAAKLSRAKCKLWDVVRTRKSTCDGTNWSKETYHKALK